MEAKKQSVEELLITIIEYDYRHQTKFNALSAASHCFDTCNNTVRVVLCYKTMQLFK